MEISHELSSIMYNMNYVWIRKEKAFEENYYWLMGERKKKSLVVRIDESKFKEFKQKYNSYKYTTNIPKIEMYDNFNGKTIMLSDDEWIHPSIDDLLQFKNKIRELESNEDYYHIQLRSFKYMDKRIGLEMKKKNEDHSKRVILLPDYGFERDLGAGEIFQVDWIEYLRTMYKNCVIYVRVEKSDYIKESIETLYNDIFD